MPVFSVIMGVESKECPNSRSRDAILDNYHIPMRGTFLLMALRYGEGLVIMQVCGSSSTPFQ